MTQKRAIPHPDKAQQHRYISPERRLEEVLVHIVRACQELLHDWVAELQGQGQHAHRRADGEAAAHPVPEAEDVLRADAEVHHLAGGSAT